MGKVTRYSHDAARDSDVDDCAEAHIDVKANANKQNIERTLFIAEKGLEIDMF
jgi:hypothetical protein